MNSGDLPFSEACERNKRPILECLQELLPESGTVLEIGSGTGQHVTWFAPRFPRLAWQPSDRPDYLPGLSARIVQSGASNVRPPILLDAEGAWPGERFAAAYSANTAHIMSWPAVCAMFAGIAACLEPGGTFALYGPFNEHGAFTSASNQAFDHSLRQRNSEMGLRDIADLEELADRHRMTSGERFQLPSNNQLLVFRQATG